MKKKTKNQKNINKEIQMTLLFKKDVKLQIISYLAILNIPHFNDTTKKAFYKFITWYYKLFLCQQINMFNIP